MVIGNISKKISYLGIISALLGYTVSYYQVYLFHLVVLCFCLYVVVFSYKIKIFSFEVVKPILLFLAYSMLSLIWTVNIDTGLRNIFYLVCGFFTVFFIANYSNSFEDIIKVTKLIIYLSLLNFIIGFFETLGFFRLPMSPYSPYASFFGYAQTDMNDFYSYTVDTILKRPTGFNGNPNNFGFVFAIILPFIFLYSKYLKFIGFFLLVWFNIYIQSRGLFLASFIFFVVLFLFDYKKNIKYLPLGILLLALILPFLTLNLTEYRFSSTLENIVSGLEMIKSGGGDTNSSTDIRSFIYSLGFSNLLKEPFLGLGIGGIQSILEAIDFEIQSFHFYFLEILIDYGVVFYIVFLVFYIKLIVKLVKIYRISNNLNWKRISKSCAISLIIMPFASIAPSSIVYILTAWIILGLSLTLVKLYKYENNFIIQRK
ncbi:O-antigen ligase family protein [Acinetobacter calcoaceticus]|uniref:O-antigen ligase family protein n=1 Tax=Acinetobacter calcoaceticus TaxID=471 RepID=UPI0030089712